MVKREASLAGRGVEILFGQQPESTSRPEPPSDEASAPPADAEEAMAAEWAAMLEEEAATAMAGTESVGESESVSVEGPEPSGEMLIQPSAEEGRPDWPAVRVEEAEEELEAQPEEELPLLATAPAQPAEGRPLLETGPAQPAEELPLLATAPAQPAEPVQQPTVTAKAPVQETPSTTPVPAAVPVPTFEPATPAAPMYTETYAPAEEPPAPLPPPREKPEATDPIVRARLMGMLYETPTVKPTEEQLEPEGPETPEFVVEEIVGYETGQISRVREESEILQYVGLKQRQDLWNEISELYRIVPDVLCTDESQPRALRLLQEAQDILLEKPRQYDVARYKVGQAKSIVNRRLNINKWTNTYGWGAFVYEIVWIVVLASAIFFSPSVVNWIVEVTQGVQSMDPDIFSVLWNTMAWGGLGGVIGAFYSLYWHAAKVKDFDKQYMMWYIVQPVIGLLLGGLTHLLIGSGFVVARGETASGSEVAVSLFPYAVACIAGFRQRFILEIIDRVIQLLTPAAEEAPRPAQEEAPAEATPPPAS